MSGSHRMGILLGSVLLIGQFSQASAQELSWAEKMFNKQSHDFGVVARGADARFRFEITNLYRDPVHIINIRTTCGCSAAKPSKYTLASREKAYIEITMNTRKFMRRKDSNLIVTFDSPLYAEVRIPVTAYIRTDVVLDPGSINFGGVEQGNDAEKTIVVKYAGRNDWKIKEVKTSSEYITAKVEEKSRENGRVTYELTTTLKPDAPLGLINRELTLVTDDANSPHVPVLVQGEVESDVTITVASSLGKISAGSSKTFNVVLRGKKPFSIEKIECKKDKEAFKITVPEAERTVHVLPITFTAPEKGGEFAEEFIVSIAGRPQPLTFTTKATIVAGEEPAQLQSATTLPENE